MFSRCASFPNQLRHNPATQSILIRKLRKASPLPEETISTWTQTATRYTLIIHSLQLSAILQSDNSRLRWLLKDGPPKTIYYGSLLNTPTRSQVAAFIDSFFKTEPAFIKSFADNHAINTAITYLSKTADVGKRGNST